MKKLFVIALATLSFSAFADQCAWMSPVMAKRAEMLIQSGSEIASLCQPCGEVIANAKVSVARGVKITNQQGNYRSIVIGQKEVDLAYTYIKVAPNKFANVAKVIGCKADGVSEVISK